MASHTWTKDVAATYDESAAAMFDPSVLDPTVELLVALAGGGPALELAIGTGRVALPLSARGIRVAGVELSPDMAACLRAKPRADEVAVTVGDMTTTRVPGQYRLVYLVWNAIMNVTTQDEQVAVFENAAAHLEPGGRFVVEVVVPQVHGAASADLGRVFSMGDDHVGIDTHDDPVAQVLSSHHWTSGGGGMVHRSAPYRYVWPSELDLMGRLAGLRLEHRWSGWRREPFTADSTDQVAVYRRH